MFQLSTRKPQSFTGLKTEGGLIDTAARLHLSRTHTKIVPAAEIDISIVQDCGNLILASVGVQIIKSESQLQQDPAFLSFSYYIYVSSWCLLPTMFQLTDGGRKEQEEW